MIRKWMKKLGTFLGLTAALAAVGCSGDTRGSGGGGPKDTGVYFDYAGVYVTDIAMTFTDSEGAEESDSFGINMLVEQNGPSMTTAAILGRAYEESMVYDHTTSALDPFFSELYTKTYSGGSVSGDPMTLALKVDGEYPHLAYSYTYEYVLTIGEKLAY
jgi:hypothetical protein